MQSMNKTMKTKDFDYNLPSGLIAQKPATPRDSSRLLVYDNETGEVTDDKFLNIDKYLGRGDVLVFNNTKVFPARILMKKESGGRIEVFLLKEIASGRWQCLIGGRLPSNFKFLILNFKTIFKAKILKKNEDGTWVLEFSEKGKVLRSLIEKYGQTPLPPYIKTKDSKKIRQKYQTVYAKKEGSVAAPTAGLHFTSRVFAKLKKKGVQIEYVTLHVGMGTFLPVKVDDIKKHKMHAEYGVVDKKTAIRLNRAKKEGKRIICVGTTSTRILEAVTKNGKVVAVNDWINIFMYPGYKFKFVDSLITNFHLPKSTLIMLVAALIKRKTLRQAQGKQAWGKKEQIAEIKKIYEHAKKKKYRFYSFGDSMMIK